MIQITLSLLKFISFYLSLFSFFLKKLVLIVSLTVAGMGQEGVYGWNVWREVLPPYSWSSTNSSPVIDIGLMGP